MGPETYTCICGRQYRTGAVEWDHLSERERNSRIRQTHGLGLVFSGLIGVAALILYLLALFLFHWKHAGVAALILTAIPFLLFAGIFWAEVLGSKLRTRKAVELGRR